MHFETDHTNNKNHVFHLRTQFFLDGTNTCSDLQYFADGFFKSPVAN